MGQHAYYTLIASLPYLPPFEAAERLPISEKRMRERLAMLEPEDVELVVRSLEFLEWRRHPAERTDQEMVERYRKMMAATQHPILQDMIAFAADMRTIMAALRRRYRGQPAPSSGEIWGVGPWVRYIEQRWDDPDFKLKAVYPWIPQAKAYLEQGQTLILERFLLKQLWNHVDRMIQTNDFGIESVLAYLFKWGLLKQWLSQDVKAAKVRFDDLVSEVMNEHQQLFN